MACSPPGTDFNDARRNAARVAYEAHTALRPDVPLTAVRVALTRKTVSSVDQ